MRIPRQISAAETFPLRYQMRPQRAEKDQGNAEDSDPQTFHVGLFVEGQLVGIASFHREAHADFHSQNPYRLRGMASHKDHQGRGIGRETLRAGFEELSRRDCDFLWCNARESAFLFYEKMGFEYHGLAFDIPTIGPHKVMYKRRGFSLF